LKEGDDDEEDFEEDSIAFEEVVGVVQPILRMLQVCHFYFYFYFILFYFISYFIFLFIFEKLRFNE